MNKINFAEDIKVFHRHNITLDTAYGYSKSDVPVFEIVRYTKSGVKDTSEWAIPVEHCLYVLGEEELDTSPVGFIGAMDENEEHFNLELVPVYKISELLVNAVSAGDLACAIVLQHLVTSTIRKDKELVSVNKDNDPYPFFPYFDLFQETQKTRKLETLEIAA